MWRYALHSQSTHTPLFLATLGEMWKIQFKATKVNGSLPFAGNNSWKVHIWNIWAAALLSTLSNSQWNYVSCRRRTKSFYFTLWWQCKCENETFSNSIRDAIVQKIGLSFLVDVSFPSFGKLHFNIKYLHVIRLIRPCSNKFYFIWLKCKLIPFKNPIHFIFTHHKLFSRSQLLCPRSFYGIAETARRNKRKMHRSWRISCRHAIQTFGPC